MRATRPGDYFDRFIRSRKGLDNTKLNDMDLVYIFSSLCQKSWAQCLILSVSLCISLIGFPTIYGFHSYGVFSSKFFRLDVEPSAGTSILGGVLSEISVVLFRNGCQISFVDSLSANGTFALQAMTEVDGFSLFARNRSVDLESFTLLASIDGADWHVFGAPLMRLAPEGIYFAAAPLALSPGVATSYDYRPPWPLIVSTVADSIVAAAIGISIAALGAAARPKLAKAAVVLVCAANAAVQAAVVAGYVSLGDLKAAALPFSHSLAFGLAARALAGPESALAWALAGLGLLTLTARAVDDCLIYRCCGRLGSVFPAGEACLALCAGGFLVFRRAYLLRSLRAVSGDRAAMDASWARLLEEGEPVEQALVQLERQVGLVPTDLTELRAA